MRFLPFCSGVNNSTDPLIVVGPYICDAKLFLFKLLVPKKFKNDFTGIAIIFFTSRNGCASLYFSPSFYHYRHRSVAKAPSMG